MTNAFTVEKYVRDILKVFNEKHNTCFDCIMGQGDTAVITSRLDKQSHRIFIGLPFESISEDKTEADIEALKILLGHEIAHHVYANMSLSAVNVIKLSVDNITGKYRRLLMSCCIETAADIRGKEMYLEISGKTSISDDIYKAYYNLIAQHWEKSDKKQLDALRAGYLPAKRRIQVMRMCDSFKEDNYLAVEDIAVFIDKTFRAHSSVRSNVEELIPWAKSLFQLDNFPNRINRLKKS